MESDFIMQILLIVKRKDAAAACATDSLSGAFVSESRQIAMEQISVSIMFVQMSWGFFLTGKPIKVDVRQVKSTKQEFREMIN